MKIASLGLSTTCFVIV